MKAIEKFKILVNEVGRVYGIFASYKNFPPDMLREWSIEDIGNIQKRVMSFDANEVKNALIGDGDEAKFTGRLKTALFELTSTPNIVLSNR